MPGNCTTYYPICQKTVGLRRLFLLGSGISGDTVEEFVDFVYGRLYFGIVDGSGRRLWDRARSCALRSGRFSRRNRGSGRRVRVYDPGSRRRGVRIGNGDRSRGVGYRRIDLPVDGCGRDRRRKGSGGFLRPRHSTGGEDGGCGDSSGENFLHAR